VGYEGKDVVVENLRQLQLRAPRGQRERTPLDMVGLRHGLQDPVLHEGEEVQQGMRRGRGHRAGAVSGQGAGVHG
jgi:hypothetical protein